MSTSKFTVMLTLGRHPRALELARALHSTGCRVIVAEPFDWHLCRLSRAVSRSYTVTAPNEDPEAYLQDLLDIVDREYVRMVVPVSEEALHVATLRERLPAHVRLLCPPFKQLAQLHHKLLFSHHARGLGLAVPETFPESSENAQKLMQAGNYVAKPAHSSEGCMTMICRNGVQHTPGTPGMLVQQYIEGDHISSMSLYDRGREICTVLYRGSVFSGTAAVCFERVDYAPSIKSWISNYCGQIEFSGFIAFDFVLDAQEKAWAVECNPRPTSGVHFLNHQELTTAMLAPHQIKSVSLTPGNRKQHAWATLREAFRSLLQPRCAAPGTWYGQSRIPCHSCSACRWPAPFAGEPCRSG
jgi:predicted ATP-grasp superfamily ATP-dependent carboligase